MPAETIDAAFICGPVAMIDEVEAGLLAGGVAAERIHRALLAYPTAAPLIMSSR